MGGGVNANLPVHAVPNMFAPVSAPAETIRELAWLVLGISAGIFVVVTAALDDVAVRLTRDQLIRRVLQRGGNMPAYGRNLSPAEVTALVAFLETLRPGHEPASRDSAVSAAPPAGQPSL